MKIFFVFLYYFHINFFIINLFLINFQFQFIFSLSLLCIDLTLKKVLYFNFLEILTYIQYYDKTWKTTKNTFLVYQYHNYLSEHLISWFDNFYLISFYCGVCKYRITLKRLTQNYSQNNPKYYMKPPFTEPLTGKF